MIETGTMEMNVACNVCNNSTTLTVNPVDVIQWQQGQLIQDVMPYLNAAERELLISNTCDKCFNDLFPCSDDTDTVRWEEGKEF